MKVEIFTLCDAATKDRSGKLNILGAFNTININQAPTIYPFCALAIKLRFEKIEEGHKTMKINFVDTDGNPILPTLEQTITVKVPPDEPTANVSIPVLIPQMKLENFGDYSIDLAIDGRQIGSTPLYVRKVSHE